RKSGNDVGLTTQLLSTKNTCNVEYYRCFFEGAYNNTNLSKNTDREKQLFSYIHEISATDPEKALQELNHVVDMIDQRASASTAVKIILGIKNLAEYK